MAMLNGRLVLHGVDVEPLCVKVLENWQRRTNTSLNTADREDAMAYLLGTAWEIAEFKYDRERGVRFDSHLYSILTFRVTDWLRKDEGRTKWQWSTHVYERPRPTVLSLDGPSNSGPDDGDPGRLSDLVSVRDSGDASDSEQVLAGLLHHRDIERTRDLRCLAEGPHSEAC